MRNYPKVKVAAVQASPVYLDVNASVEKACKLIREAAAQGVKLIGFPESFLPGYPYWCWMDDPISTMPFTQQFFANALECPGPELGAIARCARENQIYVCIGVTERDGSSVYDTQFMFDNNGNIMGKHRKLRPMHSEKMLWGEGDASTMKVCDTPIGRIGSLISSEHMVPVNSMAMCSQREEIHIASYPALPKKPVNYRDYETHMTLTNCYAVSNACFLILSTQVMNQEILDTLCQDNSEYRKYLQADNEQSVFGGAARILNPDGEIVSNLLPEDEEGIVVADLDLSAIGVANFFGDTTGHYCNPAVWLEVDNSEKRIVRWSGAQGDSSIAYENLIEDCEV